MKLILCLALLVASVYNIRQPGILNLQKMPADYKYPFQKMSAAELPKNFTWGNVDGVNYLTRMRNQHIPQYCGSCWAHSTISIISDRISIMRKAAFPEINLSPQTLLDYDMVDQGCHGGDYMSAFKFVKEMVFPKTVVPTIELKVTKKLTTTSNLYVKIAQVENVLFQKNTLCTQSLIMEAFLSMKNI